MKTLEVQLPDEVIARFEKLVASRGEGYVSVNTDEVGGRNALLTDLLILGLDELEAAESDFPDDE
ncbi:MAG: hypothetical protein BWK79_12625 [Beggiatoa sp. IS2]|nr:MAG: hypothetical protein BWK79_12625 [Beggiatoa sp. IS2]